jgi:hypothetical protein
MKRKIGLNAPHFHHTTFGSRNKNWLTNIEPIRMPVIKTEDLHQLLSSAGRRSSTSALQELQCSIASSALLSAPLL